MQKKPRIHSFVFWKNRLLERNTTTVSDDLYPMQANRALGSKIISTRWKLFWFCNHLLVDKDSKMFQKYVEIISDTRALLVCMGSSELKGSMNLWNVSHISYNGMSKINNWKKYPFCISQQPRNIINSHWGDRVSTWGVGVYGKIQNSKFIIDYFVVYC